MAMRRRQTDRRRRRFGAAASYKSVPIPVVTMTDDYPVYKRFLQVKFSGSATTVNLTPRTLMKIDADGYGARSDASTHRFYQVRLDSVTVWQYSQTANAPLTIRFHANLADGAASSTGSSEFSVHPSGSNATNAMCCYPDTSVAGKFYGWDEDRQLCTIERVGNDDSFGIRLGVSYR